MDHNLQSIRGTRMFLTGTRMLLTVHKSISATEFVAAAMKTFSAV